jgi:hypothetical protein
MIQNLTSVKIVINLDYLNRFKIAVKNGFENISEVSDILEKFPFLKNDIANRLNNQVLFQPGRIVETMVIQSIADHLNCVYIGNGIYENDKYLIKQDGGSGMSDLIITDKIENKEYIFEIKEPVAYGKSCGFTYDENGKVDCLTSKSEKYKEYVKSLFETGGMLESYNILENQGHNKIYEIDDVITNKFDYIISYDNNGVLSIMTIDEYKTGFSFRIDVRSCGRNTRKVFTKGKLNLIDGILYLDKNDITNITQRGGGTSSRCKYIKNNATFSFKRNDLKEVDGKLYIEFDKINQHVGEVSIQHFKK